MAIPLNVKNAVDEFRKESHSASGMSDERIYKYLKRDNPNLSWNEVDNKAQVKKDANTSPTFMNGFQSWFDYGIDENSAKFWKAGYNNSLTGLTEQLITGKQRYNLDDYDPNILEDIGSMLVSFVMPLDLIALGTGAGAGSLVLKGLGVQTAKEASKLGVKQTLKNSMGELATRQAFTLASYEGAMGGVQAGVNGEDVMGGIAKGVMHGGILGGLAGAAGGGLTYANAHLLDKFSKAGKIAAKVGEEATEAISKGERALLGLTSPVGQIGAESVVYTAGDVVTAVAKGEDVRWRDIGVSLVADLGLFGITKGMHKTFSKSMEHYKLLEEAEKAKHGVDSDGNPRHASILDKQELEARESAREKREQGDVEGAEIDEKIAETLHQEKRGVDEKYIKFKEDLQSSQEKTKILISDYVDGITEGSTERADRLITNVSEQIGAVEKLIEHATDPINPMYEGLLGSFKKHKEQLLKLSDTWKGDKVRDRQGKVIYTKDKILKESESLGIDISELDVDKPEGRKQATELIKQEKGELLEGERLRDTPITAEGEAVKILNNEQFRDKDWSGQISDKTMLKDVNERVQGTDKQKGLADVDAKIVEDTGGFEVGTDKSVKYNNSKNIVRHFIQNVFPTQIGKTVRKGAFVGDPAGKASRLNNFAKWMAEKGKEIKDVTNADYQNYLAQNPSHVTELQQLREFLQTNQISKKTFNLTQAETKGFARKYIGESPEGITYDAHSIDKNSITYVQPKTNQSITKYISTKLKNIFNKIRGNNKKISPEINQTFLTKDKKLINNNVLNSFVDKVFGAKKLKDKARVFRKSLLGWAAEKHGATSAEVELLTQEVLGDTGNVNTINKAYVSKEAQKAGATKLVKAFIKEIDAGGKKSKGKDFYSTYEIAQGLKKIGKKDVVITIQQGVKNKKPVYKDIVIDNLTATGMARYLLETSPRLNEIVPSTEAKLTKYQLESAASSLNITVEELKSQINHFKKLYPELDIQLKDTLGKFQGEIVLGRVTGHLIDIAKGDARADTIPHEVSHHVVDVLRAFGDKKSKKLIKDGERMFKGEENMVQAIGEYVAGNMKNKTMIGKVKNFLNKFWSHLKHKLNVHNKNDVARILGERVMRGDLPEQRAKEFITKYQTAKQSPQAKTEIKKLNREIHEGGMDSLDRRVKKADLKGYNKVRTEIFGDTTFKADNITLDQIQRYQEYLVDHPANYGNSKSAEPIFRRIQDINDKYHVHPEVAKASLELMGVEGGKYENASPETMKAYESMVRNEYEAPPVKDTNYTDILSLRDQDASKKQPWMYRYGRAVMPVWLVLKNYGGKAGKKISNRLLNHEWAEHVLYKGPGDQAINIIKTTLGKKKSKNAVLIFDKERADRLYQEGELSKSQQDFYEKVHGKNKDIKSDEYRAYQVWDRYKTEIWKELEKALLKHETPESAKTIMAEMKSIEVDNYMTRAWTKKALKYLHKDSNYINEMVEKQANQLAKKQAKEKAKSDTEAKVLEDKYKDPNSIEGEKLRSEIREEMFKALKYGYGHVKNPHLIPRKGLMKEYVDITNDRGIQERIKVYDDTIEGTAGMYVRRMSKHLANVSYFPEWTGTGSKHKIHTGTLSEIVKLAEDGREGGGIATYANLAVERQLGFERDLKKSLASPFYKAGGIIASSSAAMGLSSPLSGMKNLAIGIPRSIGVHGFWRTMSGIKHMFDASAWHEARNKGYLEYGAKNLELDEIGFDVLGKKLNMRNLFKFNFMTQTENMNRIISSHAGQLYFDQVVSKLRGEKGMFKMKTNKSRMRRLMEEVWHLSGDEISFLENTKDLSSVDVKGKYSSIINKVGHFSHVTTQGGTSTVLLPLWMSSTEAKPLTLFQRMATATTIDIHRNFIKPIQEFGNFAPLLRATLAHSASGAALYFVFKEAFGKEPPTGSALTQDDGFSKAMLNLWRSEFFGLAGEVIPGLNPYERELGVPIIEPVIIRNILEANKQIAKVRGGGQTLGQAIKSWTKQTVVVANQAMTLFDTTLYKNSPYYKDFMATRAMVRTFKKQRDLPMFSGDGTISRRQPYYTDLKEAIMFGKEEDVAKAYWDAMSFVITDEGRVDPYSTPRKRYKKAQQAIKSVMSHYKPLNISDERKGTSKDLMNQFYDWLSPENEKMVRKVAKLYEYKNRDLQKIIHKSKWRNKYFAYPKNV